MTGAEVELTTIVAWVSALSLFLSFGTAAWSVLNSGAKKNGDAIRNQGDRLDRHERRIQSIEERITSLPVREDMHKLELQLANMNGQMTVLNEKIAGREGLFARLESMVERHEEHLLSGARK